MPIYVIKSRRRSCNNVTSKKRIDRWHCEKRVAERLGITYTKRMRDAILTAIREKKAVFVKKSSNSRTVWKNVVPGHPEVCVVYSKSTKEIITMYIPKEMDSNP